MLNIKTLIAATVLSGVAVASFAQAPVAAKTTPATPALTAAAPATTTTAATPVVKKMKHHHGKKVAKTAEVAAK